jgi:ATP-dependent Clp protease protease subunit
METLTIEIPKYVENMDLPDPVLLQYYKNLQERVIWIDYDIGDNLLEVVKLIIDINKRDCGIPIEDRNPIKICIFSYGGNIDSTLSLLDVCALSKTPVITINFGVSMSAGLLLFLAGHTRYALAKSQFLFHSGSAGIAGTFEQTDAAMKNYKKTIAVVEKYVLERTKIDPKVFNRNRGREWYIYSEEAVSLGICDAIVTDISDIL